MDPHQLPKVELHLHLDTSLSYDVVRVLSPEVTREEYERDFRAPDRCTNLAEFLLSATRGFLLMQTEHNLNLVVDDIFRQLAADNILYAELRFAPLLHLECGLTPEQVVRIVDRAVERNIRSTGIEARIILCTLRHYARAQSLYTAHLVHDFRGSRVVAIDLAADEARFPLNPHIDAYRYCRDHGLFRTAHAGEALGPGSVRDTLRLLDPTRIGHGTRSYEDADLVEQLKKTRIHLELCPHSNVQIIPSLTSMATHPIDRLYRAGVRLNINTDGRMCTPTNMNREYLSVVETFGWTAADFLATNLMAIDAAFCDDASKERLRASLHAAYAPLLQNSESVPSLPIIQLP